jgi:hypothetical protein
MISYDRQDCRIAFFPGGRHGGDRSPNQDTLNLHPRMGEAFIDMKILRACYCFGTNGIACNAPP